MIAHGCIFLIFFFWEIGLYSVYMGDTTVHPCTLDIKANLAPQQKKKNTLFNICVVYVETIIGAHPILIQG